MQITAAVARERFGGNLQELPGFGKHRALIMRHAGFD